jgi:nitroreductase
MSKKAQTQTEIHPLLAERWSPRSFDETAVISTEDIVGLLEAARWAPSASNNQPWRFAVAKRGDELFTNIHSTLMGFNKAWTPRAAALIVLAVDTVDAEGKPRKWALYDAGLAASLLTVEAHARGYHVHTMAGFDAEQAKTFLGAADTVQPIMVLAVGKLAPADQLEDALHQRELADRSRLSLDEILLQPLP